ncbi:unnamed protein product [Gordionus sp. m RMFG-2023]|uniref:broad substrate specificity ATP-binding cassette transporter ABCG2-like n=1 Tax=Gordionus sp. m RMFG-2023 TaxID=3053472 RepID=UPI0030E2C65F
MNLEESKVIFNLPPNKTFKLTTIEPPIYTNHAYSRTSESQAFPNGHHGSESWFHGILDGKDSKFIDDQQVLDRLSFKRTVLSFRDLNYVIPAKKRYFWSQRGPSHVILDRVIGIFKPGVNAIMGPSGSGKTSLLTVLAGRRDFLGVDGLILIDGKPVSKNFNNETGFVTQDDIMMGTLTVRENIMFSASLRLSSKISIQKKRMMVDRIIDELNLAKCADNKVGTQLIRGISGGEKKRCSIGIELITIPSILFLDEPTSGLDAATAYSVIQLLNKLSDKGCNIIMSIHQPRYDIFKMFDSLILLSRGQLVFNGKADKSLDYFASIGFKCEIHNNPADYFLDLIEGNAIKYTSNGEKKHETDENNNPKVNLHTKYKESEYYRETLSKLDEIEKNIPEIKKENFFEHRNSTMYHATFCQQLRIVSKRTVMNLYRNPQPIFVQSFTMMIYSFIVGTIYFNVDNSASFGLQNRQGAIFFIMMNQVFGNMSSIDMFMRVRVIYIHEATNGFYRVSVFFISKIFCDLLPMRVIPILIVSIISYWMIGFRPYTVNYLTFMLSLLCITTSASSIALCSSVVFDNVQVATNYCILLLVFMMVLGGLFVNLKSIAVNLQWLKYMSIFRYGYSALLINEIKDSVFCDPDDKLQNGTIYPKCISGNSYMNHQGIRYGTPWNLYSNHLALICIILIFWTLAYIQLRRLKKNAN